MRACLMQRIIYVSSARHSVQPEHIADILSSSRRNNARANVTGLLIFHEGMFLQVLEGEEEVVSELYARISGDSRHGNCRLLMREEIDERAFESWAMAFRLGADLESRQIQYLQDVRSVADRFDAGQFGDHPETNILLRTFLASVRILDPA